MLLFGCYGTGQTPTSATKRTYLPIAMQDYFAGKSGSRIPIDYIAGGLLFLIRLRIYS